MAIYFAQSVALVPSLQARGKGQAAPFVIKLKARGKFNRYFTCKKTSGRFWTMFLLTQFLLFSK